MAFEFNQVSNFSVGNAIKNIGSKISKFTAKVESGITSYTGINAPVSGTSSTTYCFPEELRSDRSDWPYVRFKVIDGPAICLPVPVGVIIADSAQYSAIDLGVLESAINVAEEIASSGTTGGIDRAKMAMSQVGRDLKGYSALALQIAGQKAGADRVAAALAISGKKIVAPRTNAIFQNMSIRGFGFAFKMIARSAKDSMAIKNIVDTFRNNAYPVSEGSGAVLNFPATWDIGFYDRDVENKFISKIKRCYLVALSTTYNSSTNLFHDDGAPVEVDVSIQFQEMKTLTRQDLMNDSSEYYKG